MGRGWDGSCLVSANQSRRRCRPHVKSCQRHVTSSLTLSSRHLCDATRRDSRLAEALPTMLPTSNQPEPPPVSSAYLCMCLSDSACDCACACVCVAPCHVRWRAGVFFHFIALSRLGSCVGQPMTQTQQHVYEHRPLVFAGMRVAVYASTVWDMKCAHGWRDGRVAGRDNRLGFMLVYPAVS